MSNQPQQARSETTSLEPRERLPWDSNQPFRILSNDGGGIRGIFPAAILATLERDYLGGQRVGDYFDLIAGTSTGGIIALGLAAGLSAPEIEGMYLDEGHLVFPTTKRGITGALRRFIRARYDRKALDALLQERVGGKDVEGIEVSTARTRDGGRERGGVGVQGPRTTPTTGSMGTR